MRKHLVGFSVMTVTLSVMVLAAQGGPETTTGGNNRAAPTSPAGGSGLQTGRGPVRPQGRTPRLPDGTVDLSGVWNGGGPVGDLAQGLPKGETIPLTAEAKKLMESRQSGDDPEANCLPTGVPRIAP